MTAGGSDVMLRPESGSERSSRIWALVAMACMLAVFLGLRFGTGVLQSPERWDEPYITVPMFELMEQGWSVDTAIDFEETKGPALIWPYALLGQAMGGSLDDLRLVSGLFFVLCVVKGCCTSWLDSSCCRMKSSLASL